MTFFELEKECKRRKRNRLILIFLLFLIVISSVVVLKFLYFKEKSKKNLKKQPIKLVVKKVKKTENKKNINNTFVLKPIIDLNITDYTEIKNEKRIKRINKHVKTIKKEKNKTKNTILSSTPLPSFETSIKLAEKYYKEGDYLNALKWAKNANIQNKNNPKSWILVAKSLYKLGKKDKAIKILKIYYKYTKNKDVLGLIRRMTNGEKF